MLVRAQVRALWRDGDPDVVRAAALACAELDANDAVSEIEQTLARAPRDCVRGRSESILRRALHLRGSRRVGGRHTQEKRRRRATFLARADLAGMRLTHIIPVLLSLSALISAQSVAVIPADHTNREGTSAITNAPLSGGISRVQVVYSRWRIGIPHGAQINRVGVRPDQAGTGAGRQIQLEIWMAHTDNTGSTVSATFANNYTTPAVRVYDSKIFAMPTVPSVPTGPNNSYVWFQLDRPFTYDESKNLIVEYRITANNNGNQPFSYRLDRASFVSATTMFGTACPTSDNRMPATTTGEASVGGTMLVSLANGPANSAGVLLLGTSNTTWNGVPLPLSLTALGATNCSLQVAIDVNVNISTTGGGTFGVFIPVPAVLDLYGAWFYAQIAAVDVFANAAGFVTSRGGGTQIGALPQITTVTATGNATAPTGAVAQNIGVVSVIGY